ncbi:MAG: hypothetical protein JSR58_07310 [Verrucomicrobia bacterium]|nr:hypothetical protein [Verrucomicrobiota bacterium]
MDLKKVATYSAAAGLASLTAISPMVRLDPKAALLVGVIAGIFALAQEWIAKQSDTDPKNKVEDARVLHGLSVIVTTLGPALLTLPILKLAKYDTCFAGIFLSYSAGYLGKFIVEAYSRKKTD